MAIDRYTDNYKIKLSSGKILTLDADTIVVTGDISLSGNLGNTIISGTLGVTGITTLTDSLVPNGGISVATSLGITATGAGSDITITATDKIVLDSTGNAEVNCDDFDVTCDSFSLTGTAVEGCVLTSGGTMSVSSDNTMSVHGSDGHASQCSIWLNTAGLFSSGLVDASHAFEFLNSSTDADADVAEFRTLAESPDETTAFCKFKTGAAQTLRGSIRGGASSTSPAFISQGISGDSIAEGSGDQVEVDVQGDAVFASGNADYGEWVRAGDESEWPFEKIENSRYLGLPEGYVVFVRDGAFYKESPGTPMVVSHRSIVVGNERDADKYTGQILSFIGQLPVYIMGAVTSGDFIIPSSEYYCKAISPSEISFNDYMRVIGTAWGTSLGDGIKKVMCSVGIKNTH